MSFLGDPNDYPGVREAVYGGVTDIGSGDSAMKSGSNGSVLDWVNGSLGSGVIGGVLSLAGSGLQYHLNKKLMKYEADLNRENWERTNAYNTPAAQMQRLMAAGLNPNLALGDNGNAGTAAMVHNSPTISNPASAMASSVSAIKGLQLQDAQEDLMRAQAQELRSRVAGNEMKPDLMKSQIDQIYSIIGRNDILNDKDREEIKNLVVERDKISQELSNLIVEGDILSEKYLQERIKTMYEEKFQKAEIARIQAQTHLSYQQAKLVFEQTRDIVATRAPRIAKINAETENITQRNELIKNEIIAMQDEVVEGMYAQKRFMTYDEYGNRTISDNAYRQMTIEHVGNVAFGWAGRIFNVSRTFSSFQGETNSENYNESYGRSDIYSHREDSETKSYEMHRGKYTGDGTISRTHHTR